MAFTNIYNYLKRSKEGHWHDKLTTSTILQNNRIEREEDIRKEQRDCSYIVLQKEYLLLLTS
jgi:hypothetical protein